MSNNPFHSTDFHLWWLDRDGKRIAKVFKSKQEAASFIRKTPHLARYGQAGCYMRTESRKVARDGKQTVTIVQEDMWTLQELVAMATTAGNRPMPAGDRED
jgi:mannose/fructose/N-acetylgalactosamine-specific phosphotransferase system component IIB